MSSAVEMTVGDEGGAGRGVEGRRLRAHQGPHHDLEWSFRLCEDSDEMLASYIDLGEVFEIREGDEVVGHIQVVPRDDSTWEVTSLALAERVRGRGFGREALGEVE